MENSSPIVAKSLGSFIPADLVDTSSPTVRGVTSSDNVNDETLTTTSPPLVVTPLQPIRTFDDSNNDGTHNTTTPPSPMVTTQQIIKPLDDSDNESYGAGASSDSVPIKRRRGRPKGSKTSKKKRQNDLNISNNESYGARASSDIVPIKRGRGRPKGSKTSKKKKPNDLNISNNESYDAGASSDFVPIKRGRGRPKGSKTSKKNKQNDLNISDSESYDVGSSSDTIKRGRGRPKGSKPSTTKKNKQNDLNIKVVTRVTPCPNFDSGITEAERETGNQELVDSVLMRFDAVRRRLCQLNYMKDILLTASMNCMNSGIKTNSRKRIGPVPGVHVGDIFYFWGEMRLIGLHTLQVCGIDYMMGKDSSVDGTIATSVVASGYYDDETEEIDSLIYTGQGGRNRDGLLYDQKLEKGNLALEESKKKGNEIRVIRGKEDPNDKKKKIYLYDGIYYVSDSWEEKGRTGFVEFKFKLVRKLGQPSGYAIWKLAENLRKHGSNYARKGFIIEDLSYGNEILPVSLVNDEDENDKKIPEDFVYIRSQDYSSMTLDVHVNRPSLGCKDCQGESCKDTNCMCCYANGGELPYHNNILVCRKPMIYECGQSCPCLDYCENRVVQTGLKIRLEVFKTSNCGWGLRSWEPIRAGTFICEFVGRNKTKEEVEDDDDYLFDTSRIYNQFKWNYEPELVGEDVWQQVPELFNHQSQVLISARTHGNVGRFMNHSCSPNVLWQLIDYEVKGKSYVRIGFFAMKHIPPLTELRYDYGVSCVEKIGEDETLLKGKKICHCGSANCRGSFG